MHSLERLFNPKSIAVVGASADEYKAGYQMLYSLKGFPGELIPINPKEKSILGFRAYPGIKEIGRPVDLVILTIPAAVCTDMLKEAGESGAGSALIISGGFAETGENGEKIQHELLAICRKYNVRLLGPNTAGYVNPVSRVFPNFNPWSSELRPGPIGLISQSGAMMLTLSALIHTQNLGISLAAGIGNGVDVNASDAIEYLAQDDGTKVILLYLEGVRHGRKLYDAVRNTTDRKPVLVLTVGEGNVAEFALSHTGNLLGSYKVKIAALKQAGAVVVSASDELIDAANFLSRVRLEPKENPGVALLTGQAGPGMVIADRLRSNGIILPEFEQSTVEKIKRELPPSTFVKNPVDTTRPGKGFPNVLKAMAKDPSIDVLAVFAIDEPAVIDPVALFKGVKNLRKPVIFGTAGFPEYINPVKNQLSNMNIAAYPSPDRVAKSIMALVADAKAAYRKTTSGKIPKLDFDTESLTQNPDEAESKALLNKIGISIPKGIVCKNHEAANKTFSLLKKPCVVKVLDASINHKTEAGGVILEVKTIEDLTSALNIIDSIPSTSGKRRYLIEETADGGLEVIIGAVNDPSFGPAVMLGLGGVTAEAFGDVSMRIAPFDTSEAYQMISELKTRSLFDGFRGSPALDKQSLADALAAIGQLMTHHPEIKEMDLNPVRLYKKGLLALDALIIVE